MSRPVDRNVVLQARGLSKRYPGSASDALRHVDLSVSSGEVVAVVGESGCGKTTLLRLIAGLETPTAGEIMLGGVTASTARNIIPPEQRGVGLVFQDYALFPHLSVLQNVEFGLHRLPRGRRRTRALDVLTLVGLQDFRQRYPHELSGGQQQRVALARALAPEPLLLLLDEPFSNLDVVSRAAVREEIAQVIRKAGSTALFVVHDLEDVLGVADRIAILRQGALQQVDSPRAVYHRPADEYVARLFGSTNLLPGRPRAGGFETPIGFIVAPDAGSYADPVTLSLRPQDLQICTPDCPRAVPAVVRHARFRGDWQDLVVEVNGAGGAVHELLVHTRADHTVAPGEALSVRAVPGTVRVLGGQPL
jgi:iron(III) transport system ATP-binding protein